MAVETRFKVFRQELLKVFMTGVIFYFMTLWLTSWVFTLSKAISNSRSWKESKVLDQRKNYDAWVKRIK